MNYDRSQFDFAGFLSYSSVDASIVRWLHKRLERYVVPKPLRDHVGGKKRLGRFFMDRTDLPAARILSAQIQGALSRSERLIVVCSPKAADSAWVNEEILAFRSLGRDPNVLAVVVDGDPPACFPRALQTPEPIAADLRTDFDGREAGFLKLVAGVLGVSYGALRDREAKAARERKALLVGLLALFVVLFLGSIVGLTGSLMYSKKASQLAIAAIAASGTISDEAMSLALNSQVDMGGLLRLVAVSDEQLDLLYGHGIELHELKQRHAWTSVRAAQAMLWNDRNVEAQAWATKAIGLSDGSQAYSAYLTRGSALTVLSEVSMRAGNSSAAVDYAKRSISETQQLGAMNSPSDSQPRIALAESLTQLGRAELAHGQHSKALSAQYQAMDLYRKLYAEAPDSATFPMKISKIAQLIAELEESAGNVNAASAMRIENSRYYAKFLAHNVGRRHLHQEGLEIAVRAAKHLFRVGRQSDAIDMLRIGEEAMATLWSKDMTDESVMHNLERVRAMVEAAERGRNPFQDNEAAPPPRR